MNARVLVTGASGFIGSAVTRALLRHGYAVRALVRATSNTRNLDGLGVERARGDLLDASSLDHALRGCEGLFHVAADYRLWAPRPHALYRTNVRGTHAILLAARRRGLRRIVYTSSVATLGLSAGGAPADEDTPARLADMVGAYKRSKFLAESIARRCAHAGTQIVIVNPAAPVGPRDARPTPTGRLVLDAARGRMPAYVDTGLCVVHVDDVAEGHVLAYERGERGRRYVLGGENLSLRAILDIIAELTGRPAPRLRLPHAAALALAYVAEGCARISGRVPGITVDGVKLSRHHMYFSSRRAEAELGYRARPAREALADAIQWSRDNDYLR